MNLLLKALLAFILAGLASNAFALRGEHLEFCGDAAGWPPYTFELNKDVKGYDLDVLEAILIPAGINFEVVMLPWARCLELTLIGDYQVALSSSLNAERKRRYVYTKPYYTVDLVYIYDSNRFQNGLEITQASDLTNYTLCGLRGYNYDNFGVKTKRVNRGAITTNQLVHMTLTGRCDLFIDRYQTLTSFTLLGEDHLRDGLTAKAIPGVKPETFHMLISKAYPKALELAELLNTRIEQLRAEGSLDAMLDHYMND